MHLFVLSCPVPTKDCVQGHVQKLSFMRPWLSPALLTLHHTQSRQYAQQALSQMQHPRKQTKGGKRAKADETDLEPVLPQSCGCQTLHPGTLGLWNGLPISW